MGTGTRKKARKTEGKGSRKVSVYLNPGMAYALRVIAAERETTMSYLVAEALFRLVNGWRRGRVKGKGVRQTSPTAG